MPHPKEPGTFTLTAPTMTYPTDVALPQRLFNPPPVTKEPPPPIDLRIDATNQVFWNNSPVAVGTLQQMMDTEVQRDPTNQPELRIDSSNGSEDETTARVLAGAKNAQMRKINCVNRQ